MKDLDGSKCFPMGVKPNEKCFIFAVFILAVGPLSIRCGAHENELGALRRSFVRHRRKLVPELRRLRSPPSYVVDPDKHDDCVRMFRREQLRKRERSELDRNDQFVADDTLGHASSYGS